MGEGETGRSRAEHGRPARRAASRSGTDPSVLLVQLVVTSGALVCCFATAAVYSLSCLLPFCSTLSVSLAI